MRTVAEHLDVESPEVHTEHPDKPHRHYIVHAHARARLTVREVGAA